MKPSEEMKPLPVRQLRFSKDMVGLAIGLGLLGLGLIFGPWPWGMMPGVLCVAVGLGVFMTAGYYWGCDNESCS